MIPGLFDQIINVNRLQDIPGGDQVDYAPYITGVPCTVQQSDAEISLDLPGGHGKNWLLFCGPTDIVEGDQIDWDGKLYRVQAVDRLEFMGEAHMEILIRIFES